MNGASRGGLIGRLADEFELEWTRNPPARIEYYFRRLMTGEASVLDAAGRVALLEELIKLDLEFRWRAGGKPASKWRVRDYIEKFSDHLSPAWSSVALVCEEFRVRRQWGDRPSRADFAREYSHCEPHLTPLLDGVERSLQAAASPSATGPYIPAAEPVPAPRGKRPELPTIPGYEIRGKLGQGGMGAVYRGLDSRLKREVALKVITAVSARGESVARFLKEAQAVAKLKHPNIVQVFGFGEFEGRPYFAMEFVAGGSLHDYLRGTPQPPAFAAEIVETLARAMGYAHKLGIVHRDLKPANVLLDADGVAAGRPGRAKVTDFGLVKLLHDPDDPARDTAAAHRTDDAGYMTLPNAVMGTPYYMAPEQAEGRTRDVGPAADTYALGAVLYEILVGQPPFKGATAEDTLHMVRTREPVAPRMLRPGVPLDLETICLKCLQKDPKNRYATADDLADDLGRFSRGEPILARPVGPAEQAWKFYRRNPRVVYAGAGLVALGLLALTASVVAAVSSSARAAAVTARAKAEDEKNSAVIAKTEAELAEKKVQAEKAKAELEAAQKLANKQYDLLIGAGERDLSSPRGDVARAETTLALCPPEYRGWEWDYLQRLCDGRPEPLAGHEAGVWSVAFHPTRDEIATAGIDGAVRLWDLTAKTNTVFDRHKLSRDQVLARASPAALKDPAATFAAVTDRAGGIESMLARGADTFRTVTAAPFAPGAKNPAARADPAQFVKLLDVPQHLSPVLRVAYNRDGTVLASGALDPNLGAAEASGGRLTVKPIGTVLVWDRAMNVIRKFTDHNVIVTALAFDPAPNSTRIASAGMDDDHCWKLWDYRNTNPARSISGHGGWIAQLRFSPDGARVATGSSDGTAKLWDTATGTLLRTFDDHHATVYDVAFDRSGKLLATAGMDGTVMIWDLTAGDSKAKPVSTLRGHIGAALGVAFSADGTRVATAGYDRTVRLWDPKLGAPKPEPGAAPPRPGDDDPASADEKITLRGHTDIVWGVAFSSDGKKLASAGFDGHARVWDATPLGPPPNRFVLRNSDAEQLRNEDHRVNRLAFNSNGTRLATASWDRTVCVWDADAKDNIIPLKTLRHDGPVWGVAYSPDDKRILTGSWDTTVRLWNAETGEEETKPGTENAPKFGRLKSPVQSVAYSPNGRLVAAGSWDGKIKVWNADTGELNAIQPEGHRLPVFGLAFSPDGAYLASASGDRTAKLWPLNGGKPVELGGHTATVFGVAFAPDGRRVAVASWDRTVKVWHFDGGRASFERDLIAPGPTDAAAGAHADCVYGVAFSPDGRHLSTVSHDKTLRVWDAATGAPVGGPRTQRGVVWDVAYRPGAANQVAVAVWNPKCWVTILDRGD